MTCSLTPRMWVWAARLIVPRQRRRHRASNAGVMNPASPFNDPGIPLLGVGLSGCGQRWRGIYFAGEAGSTPARSTKPTEGAAGMLRETWLGWQCAGETPAFNLPPARVLWSRNLRPSQSGERAGFTLRGANARNLAPSQETENVAALQSSLSRSSHSEATGAACRERYGTRAHLRFARRSEYAEKNLPVLLHELRSCSLLAATGVQNSFALDCASNRLESAAMPTCLCGLWRGGLCSRVLLNTITAEAKGSRVGIRTVRKYGRAIVSEPVALPSLYEKRTD